MSPTGACRSCRPKAYITGQGVAGNRQRSVQYHAGLSCGLLYALEVIKALGRGPCGRPGPAGRTSHLPDWTGPGSNLGPLEYRPDVRLEVTSYTVPCKQQTQWFKTGLHADLRRSIRAGAAVRAGAG